MANGEVYEYFANDTTCDRMRCYCYYTYDVETTEIYHDHGMGAMVMYDQVPAEILAVLLGNSAPTPYNSNPDNSAGSNPVYHDLSDLNNIWHNQDSNPDATRPG
jgi:hypothetical protein